MGEVNEAAMMLPGPGIGVCVAFWRARDLQGGQFVCSRLAVWMIEPRYPRLTPSMRISTHHNPGTAMMSHRAAFLPRAPMGSQEKSRKYEAETQSRMGMRTAKRKM